MTIFNQSMLSILVYVYNISSRINIFRPHCSGPLCLCVYLKFNLKSKLVCRDKLASKRLWPKKFCQKAFCNFSDKIRFWRIQRFPERRCPEKRSSLKAKLNRPFIIYFWSFQTNMITNFTTNICENVHTVLGFKPMTFRTWPLDHIYQFVVFWSVGPMANETMLVASIVSTQKLVSHLWKPYR